MWGRFSLFYYVFHGCKRRDDDDDDEDNDGEKSKTCLPSFSKYMYKVYT